MEIELRGGRPRAASKPRRQSLVGQLLPTLACKANSKRKQWTVYGSRYGLFKLLSAGYHPESYRKLSRKLGNKKTGPNRCARKRVNRRGLGVFSSLCVRALPVLCIVAFNIEAR